MIWFMVVWIGWQCPGGFLARLWPAGAKPLICQSRPEIYTTSSKALARKKVEQLGPGARLLKCRGLRCEDERVEWSSVVEFK